MSYTAIVDEIPCEIWLAILSQPIFLMGSKMTIRYTNIGVIIIILSIVISILVGGCIQNTETSKDNKTEHVEFVTYKDANFNFSVDYPGDWSIVQTTKSKTSFILPKQYKEGYVTLNMQIVLSIDNDGKYETIDDVITDLIQQFQENATDLRINYEKESMLGESKGKEISVSYTLHDTNCTQTTIITKIDNYFYVLIYFSPSKYHEKYINAYIHAKNSFIRDELNGY